jgi:hypothetical protein
VKNNDQTETEQTEPQDKEDENISKKRFGFNAVPPCDKHEQRNQREEEPKFLFIYFHYHPSIVKQNITTNINMLKKPTMIINLVISPNSFIRSSPPSSSVLPSHTVVSR